VEERCNKFDKESENWKACENAQEDCVKETFFLGGVGIDWPSGCGDEGRLIPDGRGLGRKMDWFACRDGSEWGLLWRSKEGILTPGAKDKPG